jgi:hypothetical protein
MNFVTVDGGRFSSKEFDGFRVELVRGDAGLRSESYSTSRTAFPGAAIIGR